MSELKASEVTLETLKNINYHEFKDTFEKLGIGDVWTAGAKKDKLIQDALERLAIIKSIEGDDTLTDEQKEAKIKEKEENIVKAKEDIVKAEVEQKEQNQSDLEKAIEQQNFSKDVLEKNLKSIQASLNNTPSVEQRKVLLAKQKAITNILNKK